MYFKCSDVPFQWLRASGWQGQPRSPPLRGLRKGPAVPGTAWLGTRPAAGSPASRSPGSAGERHLLRQQTHSTQHGPRISAASLAFPSRSSPEASAGRDSTGCCASPASRPWSPPSRGGSPRQNGLRETRRWEIWWLTAPGRQTWLEFSDPPSQVWQLGNKAVLPLLRPQSQQLDEEGRGETRQGKDQRDRTELVGMEELGEDAGCMRLETGPRTSLVPSSCSKGAPKWMVLSEH